MIYATQLRKDLKSRLYTLRYIDFSTEIQDQTSNAKATPIPAGIFAERAVISLYIKRKTKTHSLVGQIRKEHPIVITLGHNILIRCSSHLAVVGFFFFASAVLVWHTVLRVVG